MLDITDILRHQKKGLTTSDVRDIEETFVVNLRAHNTDRHFFYTQLLLNYGDNNFEEQLSYMKYNKTVKEIHDIDWKYSYFTSADISMLSSGCGVSQYLHFFC